MIPSAILLILQCSILALLIISSYFDIKHRRVCNTLTYVIGILCIPLIINNGLPSLQSIIICLLFAYEYHISKIGGADLKVLIPITLTLSVLPLIVFVMILLITSGFIHLAYSKDIPYFVPISFGYLSLLLFPLS